MPQHRPGPPAFARWVSDSARRRFETEVVGVSAPPGDETVLRAHYRQANAERLAVARGLYPTVESTTVIGGVGVDVVRPAREPVEREPDRVARPVLLCLHGGGFQWGEGPGALLEAAPVAAVSGLEVIAVDYRMAPENRYPAATEDVVAVYRALLGDTRVSSIGLFGCSAGAVLVAQVAARLIADGDPPPGALAMLHATGLELGGDSVAVAAQLNGVPPEAVVSGLIGLPYLAGVDPNDPSAFPGEHAEMLARFPPSLLVTASRDFAASSVTVMHRRLLAAGAVAELVVFDGLWHAHHVATDLPESRETFNLMARFFRSHLS